MRRSAERDLAVGRGNLLWSRRVVAYRVERRSSAVPVIGGPARSIAIGDQTLRVTQRTTGY